MWNYLLEKFFAKIILHKLIQTKEREKKRQKKMEKKTKNKEKCLHQKEQNYWSSSQKRESHAIKITIVKVTKTEGRKKVKCTNFVLLAYTAICLSHSSDPH